GAHIDEPPAARKPLGRRVDGSGESGCGRAHGGHGGELALDDRIDQIGAGPVFYAGETRGGGFGGGHAKPMLVAVAYWIPARNAGVTWIGQAQFPVAVLGPTPRCARRERKPKAAL